MESKTSWFALVPDILLCCIIIGFFTFWIKIIKILTTQLSIDEKMVSGKVGILKIQTLDSPINKVTSVKIEQSIFGRIFNYGNVCINTAAGQFLFQCQSKPKEIKKYLIDRMN